MITHCPDPVHSAAGYETAKRPLQAPGTAVVLPPYAARSSWCDPLQSTALARDGCDAVAGDRVAKMNSLIKAPVEEARFTLGA